MVGFTFSHVWYVFVGQLLLIANFALAATMLPAMMWHANLDVRVDGFRTFAFGHCWLTPRQRVTVRQICSVFGSPLTIFALFLPLFMIPTWELGWRMVKRHYRMREIAVSL